MMVRSLISMAMAGLLSGSPAALAGEKAAEPSPYQKVELKKSTVQEAVREFTAVCLAHFPDPGAFRSTINGSDAVYMLVAGSRRSGQEHWRSAKSFVNYVYGKPGEQQLAVPQCNFDAWTAATVDRQTVAVRIEEALQEHGVTKFNREAGDGYQGWSWRTKKGEPVRILYIFGPPVSGRQISLSLQMWK